MSSNNCPLCSCDSALHFFYQEKLERDFYKCQQCDLVFVDRAQLISIEDEIARYDLHDNSKRSKGYEKFLLRLVEPIEKYLSPESSHGLDYGEGPYPMLRELLNEHGFESVSGFDPIFNKVNPSISGPYDFISCCEVIEHMSKPSIDINRMISLLKKEGLLVISTGVLSKEINFRAWHYISDVTHINIFSDKTFTYIEKAYGLELIESKLDLRVFLKK